MMPKHEVRGALRQRFATTPSLPDAVLADVLERVPETPQQSPTLPRLDTGRFQTVFSATKFVVAGAIVTLFGGFLLAGVLTQPSDESAPAVGATASASIEPTSDPIAPTRSPSPDEPVATDRLPGVVFETVQVRPGLFRVLNDGAGHDLSKARSIAMTPDGAIWATQKDAVMPGRRSLYRVGRPGSVPMEFKGVIGAVSADGALWFGSDDGLHSFDGESWSRIGDGRYAGVSAAADGSVWAVHDWRVLNLKDGAMSMSPRADGLEDVIVDWADEPAGDVLTTPSGKAWIWGSGWDERAGTDDPDLRVSGGLLHFDGERWKSLEPLGKGEQFTIHSLAAGPGGTAWALVDVGSPYMHGAAPRDRRLVAHFDGARWTKVPHREVLRAVPRSPGRLILTEVVDVDETNRPTIRYGSLDPDADDTAPGGGWVAFDGQAWSEVDNVVRQHLFTTPRGDIWARSGNGRIFVTRPGTEAVSESAP